MCVLGSSFVGQVGVSYVNVVLCVTLHDARQRVHIATWCGLWTEVLGIHVVYEDVVGVAFSLVVSQLRKTREQDFFFIVVIRRACHV